MLLSDELGCPGQYIRTQGRTAAICYGCERYTKPGVQIVPVAAMVAPGGEWDCEKRRSLGHVEDVAPAAVEGSPPSSGQVPPSSWGPSFAPLQPGRSQATSLRALGDDT